MDIKFQHLKEGNRNTVVCEFIDFLKQDHPIGESCIIP